MEPTATESAFRRDLRNTGYLPGGKTAGTALYFATLVALDRTEAALAARGLGAAVTFALLPAPGPEHGLLAALRQSAK